MAEIYCGIGKVPKDHKLGSMKQCAEKGQIRYYGVKKVDPKMLTVMKTKGSRGENRDKLVIEMVTLRGRVRGLTKKIADEKDAKAKQKLKNDLAVTADELEKVQKKVKKLDDARSQSRSQSKKSSRKN